MNVRHGVTGLSGLCKTLFTKLKSRCSAVLISNGSQSHSQLLSAALLFSNSIFLSLFFWDKFTLPPAIKLNYQSRTDRNVSRLTALLVSCFFHMWEAVVCCMSFSHVGNLSQDVLFCYLVRKPLCSQDTK